MDRIEKLKQFLKDYDLGDWQKFDTKNIIGDPMVTLYDEDGIQVDVCHYYHYIEIFGLTDEEKAEFIWG